MSVMRVMCIGLIFACGIGWDGMGWDGIGLDQLDWHGKY